ncbi:MAG TPA: acetylornithine deacetylase [Thermoanaerobaculia bacterium]|jgi:acetylornithine deacetylase|nr:acetylornithine deacetylase [Thermoanaerobaculia bacterium]
MPALLSDAELLARIVAFDTVSSNSNLPLVDFISEYLDRPGVRIERHPSPDGTKANLIVRVGPEREDSAGLALSGHMDVVPAGEPGWESDPFTLTDRGDRWVARGACDMKGFVALAVNLAAEAAQPDRLARMTAPLALVITYDEEVGTLGARWLAEDYGGCGTLPRAMIIGEPTSLAVVGLHKGHLKMRATFSGKSAHSGYPHLGANAIVPAGRAIVALAELGVGLEREGAPSSASFPDVPFAAINVGTVHGGSAINVVPDACVVEIGVRTMPGLESARLAPRVEAAITSVPLPAGVTVRTEILSDSPPMMLSPDAPIHRLLFDLTGQKETRSVGFATDAGWLARAGFDCAVFGPGTIEVAHKPNEWLPKSEYAKAREIVERAITRLCEDPQ